MISKKHDNVDEVVLALILACNNVNYMRENDYEDNIFIFFVVCCLSFPIHCLLSRTLHQSLLAHCLPVL